MTSPTLRRGFRAEAERIAARVRGPGLAVRLDPVALANQLGVVTIELGSLRSLGASAEAVALLEDKGAGFCALTVRDGDHAIIVYNSLASPGRRANSLAHELSHLILGHRAGSALGLGGCRRWDPSQEAEADWLAGTLLVPRRGLLAYLRQGGSISEGPDHFGVSQALFQWRYRVTGVSLQLSRWHKRVPSSITQVR